MKKILVTLFCLIILSCEVPYINNAYSSDKVSSFNYLCNELDNHYVYTDIKGFGSIADLKAKYSGKVTNTMTDEAFFEVLSDFINELKDGHANIITPFARSSYYPTLIDYMAADYNPNYNSRSILINYFNSKPLYGSSLRNGIIEKEDGKKYGYIYYGSFMDTFSSYDIDYMLNRFSKESVEGILLDIRGNGGGSIQLAINLLSYFGYDPNANAKEVLKVWRRDDKNTYTKIPYISSALGVDFSFNIYTMPNGYKGKVALLTNRACYSAASLTAAGFKAYNNVKQFGDQTGGGMGLPIGGTLPNGWNYRFSSNKVMDYRATSHTQTEYNYEAGVSADSVVNDDPLTTDKDEIIEAAISWISTP